MTGRAPRGISSSLGWQETHDAAYLAAARHADAGGYTLDDRPSDGARRLGVPLAVPD